MTTKHTLTDINFQGDTAHVALVSKSQGGPANGHGYALILKSANRTPEFVQKMQQIKVTLDLPEFLRRFFDMYYEDSEVLARLLGYVEPADEDTVDWYEDYIEERVKGFEILKSLHESKDVTAAAGALSEKDCLSILKDQALVEKAFRKQVRLEKKAQKEGNTVAVDKSKVTGTTVEALPSDSTKTENTNMDHVVQLQKAQEDLAKQKVDLEKALEAIATLQAEKQETIMKSKIARIAEVVKDEAKATIVAKAALALAEDDFTALIGVFKDLGAQATAGDMFVEKGVTVETTKPAAVAGDRVAELLKAQFAPK